MSLSAEFLTPFHCLSLWIVTTFVNLIHALLGGSRKAQLTPTLVPIRFGEEATPMSFDKSTIFWDLRYWKDIGEHPRRKSFVKTTVTWSCSC